MAPHRVSIRWRNQVIFCTARTVADVWEACESQLPDGWLSVGGLPLQEAHFGVGSLACHWEPRLRGGKGAFGQRLKDEGEKMSKQTFGRRAGYRTLAGQRVGTLDDARALARRAPASDTSGRRRRVAEMERSSANGSAAGDKDGPAGESAVSASAVPAAEAKTHVRFAFKPVARRKPKRSS